MPGPLAGIALIVASFLIGAIPWGYIAGKASRGIDLRTVGSGGTGATNVLRTIGPRASAVVALLDVLKGMLPVLFASSTGFDIDLGGRGGCSRGGRALLVAVHRIQGRERCGYGRRSRDCALPLSARVVPVMALVVWTTKYVSLGSLIAAALPRSSQWPTRPRADSTGCSRSPLWPSEELSLRHEGNIRRLLQGSERRFGETILP